MFNNLLFNKNIIINKYTVIALSLSATSLLACNESVKYVEPPEVCIPQCDGKSCGYDGCGGECGQCENGNQCTTSFTCINACELPQAQRCENRVCGSDGCGNSCGSCDKNGTCNEATGQCMPWRVSGNLYFEHQLVDVKEDNAFIPTFGDIAEDPATDLMLYLTDAAGSEILGKGIVNSDASFSFETTRLPITTDRLFILPIWFVGDELKLGALEASDKEPYDIWSWNLRLGNFASSEDLGKLQDIVISVDQNSGAIYLFQQIKKAIEDLVATDFNKSIEELPSLAIVWKPNYEWTCGTCFVYKSGQEVSSIAGKYHSTHTLKVTGAHNSESAWGTPTLLHEFGHYIMFDYRDDNPGGAHSISTASNPLLAWSEGWATFYSLLAQSRELQQPVTEYWRILDNGSYWIDYQKLRGRTKTTSIGVMSFVQPDKTSTVGMRQQLSEAWVTQLLYNLWDGAEVADPENTTDPIAIKTSEWWKAIASDRYLFEEEYEYFTQPDGTKQQGTRHYVGTDLVDLLDALVCNGSVELTTLTDWISSSTTFPYDGNPACERFK